VKYKLLNFDVKGDDRGSLVALEENKNVSFNVKRVYYIYGTKEGVVRGKHAHYRVEQLAVCVSGSCDFVLDDGKNRVTIHLNRQDQGLYIGTMLWHEFMNFSPECVVMVLASDYYNESDYIRNYDKFLLEVNRQSE
jgi:dTDP-4-dehydrorhamnose 3,5-epimerase-like enzyme